MTVAVDLLPLDRETLVELNEEPDGFANTRHLVLEPHRDEIVGVASQTLRYLDTHPMPAPWCGYLAVDPETRVVVGTCAFKGPPREGAVEVAYYTFSSFEGRGCATAMAAALRSRAALDPDVHLVLAHTLPERNASGHLLEKLGFEFVGEVVDPEDGPVWRWEWRVPSIASPDNG